MYIVEICILGRRFGDRAILSLPKYLLQEKLIIQKIFLVLFRTTNNKFKYKHIIFICKFHCTLPII